MSATPSSIKIFSKLRRVKQNDERKRNARQLPTFIMVIRFNANSASTQSIRKLRYKARYNGHACMANPLENKTRALLII